MTKLAIERPLTILMAILAFVLMGAVSYTYLKIDRLPPVSIPTISVTIQQPQASAEDIEKLITEPVENAMTGIAGVDTISSTSSEGRSPVRVEMLQDSELNPASPEVQRPIPQIPG